MAALRDPSYAKRDHFGDDEPEEGAEEVDYAQKLVDFRSGGVDEAGLQARKDRLEQLRIAIEKLKSNQKTPAYLMYELASILPVGNSLWLSGMLLSDHSA